MECETSRWLYEFVRGPAFIDAYPHYASIICQMAIVIDTRVEVMAVSQRHGRFRLHVNVDFFRDKPEYLKGVLLHEVHHVVMGHLSNVKFFGADYPRLMTLAQEMSANEYIQEPLPGKPVVWQDYREFGMVSGQSTMQRYELLVAAIENDLTIPQFETIDHHDFECTREQSADGYVECWDIVADAAQQMLIFAAVADGFYSKRTLAGHAPRKWLSEIADPYTPPQSSLDWRSALDIFVDLQRTRKLTYQYPNRRHADKVGIVPGRRRHHAKSTEHKSLIVAIDTSGSMSDDTLAEIARHLNTMPKSLDITIVECDTCIQRVYPYRQKLSSVQGRGGTDLCPVFDPQFLRQHPAAGVVYFTDGLGPFPTEDPGIKTLWVLTSAYDFDCSWGRKVRLAAETYDHSRIV